MFGPYTQQVVVSIQQQLKTQPTGVYDDTVRAYLLAELGGTPAAMEEPPATAAPESPAPTTSPVTAKPDAPVELEASNDPSAETEKTETVASPVDPVTARRLLLLEMGFNEQEVAAA